MGSIILKSLLFIMIFNTAFGQIKLNDSIMCRTITALEYNNLLDENENTSLSFLSGDKIYTSFSDKKLLVKKKYKADGDIMVYKNEEAFFKHNSDDVNEKFNHPLFKYRHLMNDIAKHKDSLIKTMFKVLDLEYPKTIPEVDFDKINDKLLKMGMEEAYHKFYLHLVLFCGEYLNKTDKNQGKWKLTHNSNYPLSFQPNFIDSKGNDYYFILNINLAREMGSRFLGEDYAVDSDVDINIPFDLKAILFESFDYRDLIHKND